MTERSEQTDLLQESSEDLIDNLIQRVEDRVEVFELAQSMPWHPLRWYMSVDAMSHTATHLRGVLDDIDDLSNKEP